MQAWKKQKDAEVAAKVAATPTTSSPILAELAKAKQS